MKNAFFKIIILALLFTVPSFVSAQTIVAGFGVVSTNGVPTHTVTMGTDSELAIDSTTGLWYEYGHDCLCWKAAGFRLQHLAISIPPTAAPGDKESSFIINDVDSMYYYTGSAWVHVNAVGGGGATDLTFTGASSPVTLNSSTGTDVTFTAAGIVTLTGTSGDLTITATEVDGSVTNELQTLSVAANTTTLSDGGGSMTIAGGGINTVGTAGSTITITATEVDGSVTNELQTIDNTSDATSHTATLSDSGGSIKFVEGSGITLATTGTGLDGILTITSTGSGSTDLSFTGASSPVTLNSSTGTDVTFTAAGIVTLTGTAGDLTITATEVDGSVTNEGTLGVGAGGATSSVLLSNTSGATGVTINAAGINTISETTSANGGSITITATEVDGSVTNELQTIDNTSDATSHTATLSDSGGSIKFVEGSGITLATTGTGLDGILTITSTGSGSTDLSFTGASSPVTLNSSTGNDVTFTAAGIVTFTGTAGDLTITATEVDGSITNELQTLSVAANTTTLSDGGGSMTIAGGGINTVGTAGSTITITGTEVDGSVTNELQTIDNTSDATSHTATLSNSGGSIKFVEGTGITLATTGTGLDGVVTITSNATGTTDLSFTGASSPVTLNSSTGTDVTFTAAGIVTFTGTSGNMTITATEVDGSVTNELQTLSVATNTTTLSDGGGSMTIAGGGINTVGTAGSTITITGTEVDGSVTNEGTLGVGAGGASSSVLLSNTSGATGVTVNAAGINTISETTSANGGSITITATEVDGSITNEGTLGVGAGGASSSVLLSNTSGATGVTINAAGINTISETTSANGGSVTITATEVDGSVTNELQTITNTSDATSHTATLSNSGGSVKLVEGTGITLATTGTGLDGVVTITSTATGGTPAGANYQLQYYDTGNFGADANMNFNPTTKRLVVGTTTPVAVLHARGQDDVSDRVFLAENNSGNDIVGIYATGVTKFGDNETYPIIKQTATAGGSVNYTSNGLTFESSPVNTTGNDLFSFYHPSATGIATGAFNIMRQTGIWNPTTGSATYNSFTINPTINVAGSANGLAMGVDVSPTLTSTNGGFRSFNTNIASGTNRWAFYGGGTAASRVGGTLGVGGDPVSTFQLYSSGAVRMDGANVVRGTGDSYTGDLATSHVRLWNTANDTWYMASMNNGDFKIASSNLGAVQLAIENTTGQVQTTNSLKIGTVTGTPTTIIGRDGTGQVGTVTVSTGLDLTGGVLTATGGGGGGDVLNNGNSFGAAFIVGSNDNFTTSLEQNGTTALTIGTDKNVTLVSSVAATNTVTDRLILQTNSTGTAANNFGSGILFQAENSTTNNQDQSEIASYWKNSSNGAEISAIDFKLRTSGGALGKVLSINRSGIASGMLEIGDVNPAQITNGHFYVNANYEFGAAAFSAKLSSTTNEVGLYRSNTTATNTAVDFSVEARANGSGAAGYGTHLIFKGESSSTVARELGGIQNVWTTATDASRTSDMIFRTTNSATTAESFRVYGNKRAMVGGGTNEASAALQVTSTSAGFLPPKMTNAEMLAIASPTEGLRVHNTTTKGGCTYDGTIWKRDNCSVTPSVAAGTGAGTGGSASIVGNDLGGVVTVTCGTSPATNAPVATITFATALGAAPQSVLITAANESACSQLYVSGFTRTWLAPSTDMAAGSWIIRSGSVANTCFNGTSYLMHYSVQE